MENSTFWLWQRKLQQTDLEENGHGSKSVENGYRFRKHSSYRIDYRIVYWRNLVDWGERWTTLYQQGRLGSCLRSPPDCKTDVKNQIGVVKTSGMVLKSYNISLLDCILWIKRTTIEANKSALPIKISVANCNFFFKQNIYFELHSSFIEQVSRNTDLKIDSIRQKFRP